MGIFRKIWAVYAVILFLTMMLLSIPIVLFFMAVSSGKKALHKNIYYLYHIFTPIFLTLVGIRLKVHGKENLVAGQSYVIVSNHNSSLDFIVNAHAFPGIFRFLAKQELLKVPIFGWIVGKMCLIVDRSSQMSRARSVVEMKKELADGTSIFIYPEGSRNRSDGPLGEFFDGAFRIAIQTKAAVAVQTISNIRDITATTLSLDLSPGVLHIFWDKPIETKNMKAEDIPKLKEMVQQVMLKHLKN